MGKLADFVPSVNGLHYPNSWPHQPDLTVPTPLGAVRVGDAANGLCGGMVFAVRDLFEAGRMPPVGAGIPSGGSAAFRFIVGRLFDSFNLPDGVARYYQWMNLPQADRLLFGLVTLKGLWRRTVGDTMPALRGTLDSGHPCPIGLVCTRSVRPGDLGRNHQVLVYGYEERGNATVLSVYDPNHPDRDDVTIDFDTGDPPSTATFRYSTGDHEIRGFFTVRYRAADPSALFDDLAARGPG